MWEFVPCIDHPAAESFEAIDVRFGSLADMRADQCDVRFTAESGHWTRQAECPLSATSRHPQNRTQRCPICFGKSSIITVRRKLDNFDLFIVASMALEGVLRKFRILMRLDERYPHQPSATGA